MTSLPTPRVCAICGEWKNSNKGGIAGWELGIRFLKEAGAKMKRPESRYAHAPCMLKAQKAIKALRKELL
jgi:hypothetical protein